MSRFISLVVGALLLLWSVPALATDGDACGLTDWATSRGLIRPIWCVLICDTKVAANGTCAEYDMVTVGLPDVLVFEINTDTACSANATATLASAPTTGGTEHDLGSTTSVSRSGNTKLSIDTSRVPVDRYLSADLTNMTDCTDFDVLMIGYERWRDQ